MLALIDDSVDLYPHATAGEPNRVERILRRDPSTRRVKAIAATITRRGATLPVRVARAPAFAGASRKR